MPSVSKKQHNLMAAVANNPAFAKKTGIPQSVGAEFMKADKGKRFGSGGSRADSQAINRPKTNQGKQEFFSKGGRMAESKKMVKKEVAFMKKAGAPKSMIKHEQEEAGVKKMRIGGFSGRGTGRAVHPRVASGLAPAPKSFVPYAARGLNTQSFRGRGMAEGGLTSGHKAADGVASKGKTKGKEVKMGASKPLGMKRGGKC